MKIPEENAPREPRRNRVLQDYVERFGGEYEGRPSRQDEQAMTDDVHKRQEIESREQQAQRDTAAAEDRVRLERDLVEAILALGRLRDRFRGDRRDDQRAVEHLARRLQSHLRKILNS